MEIAGSHGDAHSVWISPKKILLLMIWNDSYYSNCEKRAQSNNEWRSMDVSSNEKLIVNSYLFCFNAVVIRHSRTSHRAKIYLYTEKKHENRQEKAYMHRYYVAKQKLLWERYCTKVTLLIILFVQCDLRTVYCNSKWTVPWRLTEHFC